jgi:hypothetical protein
MSSKLGAKRISSVFNFDMMHECLKFESLGGRRLQRGCRNGWVREEGGV